MVQIFVSANDRKGDPVVADHYEFDAVPRTGEQVVADQDGIQFLLVVKGVTNFAKTKGDIMDEISPVHLNCELIEQINPNK